MTLSEYIADTDRRRLLADAAGTIPDYLWQIATKRRKASPALARRIETATAGEVSRYELRPDVYGVGPREAA